LAGALLVYIHIPKTAGTSLRKLIGHRYPGRFRKAPNTFTHAREAVTRIPALLAGDPPPLAIGGHLVFGLRDVLPSDAHYLTVLRDPVERALSHYGYLVAPRDAGRRPHGLLQRTTPHRSDLALEEALADPRYLPDNLQTRMLVCSRSPFEELPADALARAEEHLRSFAHVGVTERMDDFVASLGWDVPPAKRRRAGERPARESLTPAQLRALEKHNALDLELYDLAAKLAGAGR
jgi:hypothetical protein